MNVHQVELRQASNADALELEYYNQLHEEKYRDKGQSKADHQVDMATNFSNGNSYLEQVLYHCLSHERFLPAGRIQAALGASDREVSPFNCSVSQKIEDDMSSIMMGVHNAAMILRLGTGIGFNFSHLRPEKDLIKKLQTEASGPLSFMRIYNEMASTIASSGHRRGAMMAILNVDHPDIEKFIDAKLEKGAYRQFNFSVGVTDKFMEAVQKNEQFPLQFEGKVYRLISARALWDKILLNAYNSAEPGVIFIDRLNEYNNLHYCEEIEATNPCAEQPLPPYGLCTLGSFNLPKYLNSNREFNYDLFAKEISLFVEGYDNIFDNAVYAIPEHKAEALSKRRIGLGFTGISTCIELMLNKPAYGSDEFCDKLDTFCAMLQYNGYMASSRLAAQRGSFPLYNKEQYLDGKYIQTLPNDVRDAISRDGIRNSHIISFAPCGTISQCAGNVSSGVEPIFYHRVERNVHMRSGLERVTLTDYAYRNFGFEGKTLEECSIEDHLKVAEVIQKYTDSAVSKTVNVASNCSYNQYKEVYQNAYDIGLKGITVFRPTEIRGAVITEAKPIEAAFSSCANGVCSL